MVPDEGRERGMAQFLIGALVLCLSACSTNPTPSTADQTVATALAGDTIQNRQLSINNNTAFYPVSAGKLTNNLLTSGSNVIKGNSIESISSILLPSPTLYTFTYQLNPAILQQMGCNSQQICFDCKYNLEISIRSEDCAGAAPIVKHYNNLQLQTAAQACSTSMVRGWMPSACPAATLDGLQNGDIISMSGKDCRHGMVFTAYR